MNRTYRATHKYAPMSARKVRPVVNMVCGRGADSALEQLEYINRRSAVLLRKVIKSAVANAAQEGGVEAKDLFIAAARVNEGPLKQRRMRWRPGPMGRAMPIHKRTCHIQVDLGVREQKATGRSKKADSAAAESEGAES